MNWNIKIKYNIWYKNHLNIEVITIGQNIQELLIIYKVLILLLIKKQIKSFKTT